MKRTRSDHKKGGIQWDEAKYALLCLRPLHVEHCYFAHETSMQNGRCSLEENDKIKSEINPRKINEPKTPYHGPMEEEPGCGTPEQNETSSQSTHF